MYLIFPQRTESCGAFLMGFQLVYMVWKNNQGFYLKEQWGRFQSYMEVNVVCRSKKRVKNLQLKAGKTRLNNCFVSVPLYKEYIKKLTSSEIHQVCEQKSNNQLLGSCLGVFNSATMYLQWGFLQYLVPSVIKL